MLEILYHKLNPFILETESKINSNKWKTCTYSRSRRKLVHDPHIGTQCS